MSILLPILAALLVFAAVLIIGLLVIDRQQQAGMRRSLALVLRIGRVKPADEELVATEIRSVVGELVSWLGDRLVLPANRRHLREQLAWSGKPSQDDLRDAIDRKVIYGLIGLCLGFLLGLLLGGVWWIALVALPAVGFFLPDLLVYNSALHRTEEILLSLPDALDLLDMCVQSGLSLQAGLGRVAESQDTPVADEFARVLREMQLGVPRAEAFDAMAKRTHQPDLQRFVSAVLAADQLGIPIASVLREQAQDMRARRRARARELAQKVPVKILAPLMLCLLPGLFIVILGPAAINAMKVFSN